MNNLIPIERIENKIYLIRGQKVMLDKDLAELYGVTNSGLIQAVKRNLERFPRDFMFQITKSEWDNLKSQIVISSLPAGKAGWGGRRTLPYVFTEQGVAMLSSILRSGKAIAVNIAIMRTFLRLRTILASHVKLAQKVAELEKATKNNSADIRMIFQAIKEMLAEPELKPEPRKFEFQVPVERQ